MNFQKEEGEIPCDKVKRPGCDKKKSDHGERKPSLLDAGVWGVQVQPRAVTAPTAKIGL